LDKPKYYHEKLGSDVDYIKELRKSSFGISDYPDYVLEDPIFNMEEPIAVLQCKNRDTGESMNVVLISSFDGKIWWCWMIEQQKFDLMEIH